LGEATPGERDEYRLHIAGCASCLSDLGGEREIERVMSTVGSARESEVWNPAPLSVTSKRPRPVPPVMRAGLSLLGVAVIVSIAVHLALAGAMRAPKVSAEEAFSPTAPPFHVTLERRVAAAPRAASQPAPQLVVVHNVINLKRDSQPAAKTAVHPQGSAIVQPTPAPAVAAASNVPVWRRDVPLPAAPPAAMAVPVLSGHAESIAIERPPVVHDAMPVGGDAAIVPQPPPIAYAQGAEGTTAFEVAVDDRGAPVKCTITKSSGFVSLDGAVCRAAMKARYQPRTVNGRPTPGVYRDAFTFRSNNNTDAQI
jgi:TonB family protein